jgi:large subunit ribosomal protein L9
VKVLLVEDINKLGWLGDVVEVNEGYARNYLLPQGLARPATDENIRAIADEKVKRAEVRLADRKRLEQVCAAVEGAEVVIASKANEQGHLFGSVTEKHIGENLRAQGFAVADEFVRMVEHIKQVGSYQVKLKFADGLTAIVNCVVVAEGTEPGVVQGPPNAKEGVWGTPQARVETEEAETKTISQESTEQEVDSGQSDSQ